MSKMIETLKKAGWVETTLGECHVGEEGLLTQAGHFPRAMQVTQPAEWGGGKGRFVNTNDGCARLLGTTPVLRAPRPEYASGTVAMIRWSEDKPPVRAWKVPGQWIPTGGIPLDDEGVEVVRVLLPADQDTPPITDEMVERAAEARYFASDEGPTRSWDKVCEAFPDAVAIFRREARAALKAALENEK